MFESALKKLKDLAFEEVPEPTKSEPAPVAAPLTVATITTPATGSVEFNSDEIPKKVDQLRSQIVPTSGPLFVFTSILNSLQAHIPNEATRFRAAVQAAAPQGITSSSILAEIGKVLQGIQDNKTEFDRVRVTKFETEVTARRKKAEELQSQLEIKQQEIAQLLTNKDSLLKEAEAAETKIKERSWQWEAARASLTDEFADLDKKLSIYFDKSQGAASK